MECIDLDANRAARVMGRIRSVLRKNSTAMTPLDINDVIREVLLLTSHETDRRRTNVTTELIDDPPPVVGDRVQLQQVLLNLIINSLDAMSAIADRPRQLHMQSSRDKDCVLIHVQDSGPGWDPRDGNSIFDPFFTTKKDGIGMGLTISRSIVETHGGRLWAERNTQGATLSFSLPIAAEAE